MRISAAIMMMIDKIGKLRERRLSRTDLRLRGRRRREQAENRDFRRSGPPRGAPGAPRGDNVRYHRHSRWDIFIHWYNAACWLFLLATGLGLIDNPALNPLGQWWPDTLRAMAGGGGNLLLIHEIGGVLWILGFLAYLAFNPAGAAFFLREIMRISPARDGAWMVKKPLSMLLGRKALSRLVEDPSIPDQGFYNMGQKSFAHAAVAGSVVIAASGVLMMISPLVLGPGATWLVSWAILVHYLFAGLVLAGLLVHIYMAAVSPEERPGFKSMFTGWVPGDYARHHHRLWFDEVNAGSCESGPDRSE